MVNGESYMYGSVGMWKVFEGPVEKHGDGLLGYGTFHIVEARGSSVKPFAGAFTVAYDVDELTQKVMSVSSWAWAQGAGDSLQFLRTSFPTTPCNLVTSLSEAAARDLCNAPQRDPAIMASALPDGLHMTAWGDQPGSANEAVLSVCSLGPATVSEFRGVPLLINATDLSCAMLADKPDLRRACAPQENNTVSGRFSPDAILYATREGYGKP